MNIQDVLLHLQSTHVLGNSLWEYCTALFVFLLSLSVLKAFQVSILHRLRSLASKSANYIDDALVEGVATLKKWAYIPISLLVALSFVQFNHTVGDWLNVVIWFVLLWQLIAAVGVAIDTLIRAHMSQQEDSDSEHTRAILRIVRGAVVVILWIVAFLLIASNIGIDVTSLIAGLGVGGIAIALALQSVLGDLLSAISILIDKPFQVGDFIEVGDSSGIVLYIGMKSTRLKTLRGEELVIPNNELTQSRIQNFRALKRRRDSIMLDVVYETDKKKLGQIPSLVEKSISEHHGVTFDRCHLARLGDYALRFELVYYVESQEYLDFMNARQDVLHGIFEAFTKYDIGFAYPTQTLNIPKK
jgi:small-conductance mechanosensitive channel